MSTISIDSLLHGENMAQISVNFRLDESIKEDLRVIGNGSMTRGLRALLDIAKADMGLRKTKARVKKEKLGFK